jgi:hypothetical protein
VILSVRCQQRRAVHDYCLHQCGRGFVVDTELNAFPRGWSVPMPNDCGPCLLERAHRERLLRMYLAAA